MITSEQEQSIIEAVQTYIIQVVPVEQQAQFMAGAEYVISILKQ
jgi:hypothetical protein